MFILLAQETTFWKADFKTMFIFAWSSLICAGSISATVYMSHKVCNKTSAAASFEETSAEEPGEYFPGTQKGPLFLEEYNTTTTPRKLPENNNNDNNNQNQNKNNINNNTLSIRRTRYSVSDVKKAMNEIERLNATTSKGRSQPRLRDLVSSGFTHFFCKALGLCLWETDTEKGQQNQKQVKPQKQEYPTNAEQQQAAATPSGGVTWQLSEECGLQAPGYWPEISSRIINGDDAAPHSWPWAVYVKAGGAVCGATLIRPDVVLTAAHCLERMNRPSDAIVTVGAHTVDGSIPGVAIRVNQAIQHENYNSITIANDIAMLRLQKPIQISEKARVACLPPAGQAVPVGSQCMVVGWGKVNNYVNRMAPVLQQASVPILSNGECRQKFGSKVRNSMICAGGKSQDSCQGDSGGPLLCKLGTQWFIQGITSWGYTECGTYGMPAIYTRVSSYVGWINAKLRQKSWPQNKWKKF